MTWRSVIGRDQASSLTRPFPPYLSHRVNPDKLKPGDHIYTWRTAFTYAHHGIYVGEDMVVHFTAPENASSGSRWNLCAIDGGFSLLKSGQNRDSGSCLCTYYCGFRQSESGVTISCLNCFIGTGSLYLYQYGVNKCAHVSKLRGGTSTTAPSDTPQDVVHRAMYLLNSEAGFGKYNVVKNNCEDFALYCKTGLLVHVKPATGSSGQVNFLINAPWKPALVSVLPKVVCSTTMGALAVGVTVGTHYWNRYKTDIGVRDDVVNVNVEDVGSFRGY